VAGGAGTGSFPIMEDGYVWMTRRDLLTLGLSVVVAGALGVASIRNAEAEQVTPGPGPGVENEPPALPWGAKPQKIRVGKPGASSDNLHALGLVAAPADSSGATQPKGRYAPKGRVGRSTLRTQITDVVPPEPAGPDGDTVAPAPSATSDPTAFFFYDYGSHKAETDGIYANVSIAKPTLSARDYHTLAELDVQTADGNQVVEVGWTVDRVVNADSDPHLFVYHWVNGVKTCYNGCGFVQVSPNVKPGDTLANGTAKRFGIQYRADARGVGWWISFDSEWIGYFPEKLWLDQGVASFNRAELVQAFGEVAAGSAKPCSQMGNGAAGTDSSSAVLGSVAYPTVGPAVDLTLSVLPDNSTYYTMQRLSPRTLQYGGPVPKGC
jgi:hypothetical protein